MNEEILNRIEHLESQLEILKQYTENISNIQLKMLELISKTLSPGDQH